MVFQSVVVGPSIARQLLAGLMQSRNENSIKQPSDNFEFAADGAAQYVIHLNLSTVRPSVVQLMRLLPSWLAVIMSRALIGRFIRGTAVDEN